MKLPVVIIAAIVAVGNCAASPAQTSSSSSSAASSGPKQIQPETELRAYEEQFAPPENGGMPGGSGEMLRITAVEGDDLPVDPKQAELLGGSYCRVTTRGCSVSLEGQLSCFYTSSSDVKGFGFPVLTQSELKKLSSLIAQLPDEHSQLPPPGRRVIVQAMISGKPVIHVYDRADMPDSVLGLIRLTGAQIQPWRIDVPAQKAGTMAEYSSAGIRVPSYHTFSPDGSLDFAQGYQFDLVTTPTGTRTLEEPKIGRRIDSLYGPFFTPDGRYLLLQSTRPAIRIFDTKSWEPVPKLEGLPATAVAYFPDKGWKKAVFRTADGNIGLWESNRLRDVADFGFGEILDVAFSPDHSLVAIATAEGDKQMRGANHVRIWNADTGDFVVELQPQREIQQLGTAGFGPMRGLLGWLGNRYLLTIVRPDEFFTSHNIAVWNVRSGKYRGYLSGCVNWIDRFIVSDDEGRVFAECHYGNVLMWDAKSAVERIAKFENRLSEPEELRGAQQSDATAVLSKHWRSCRQ